MDRVPSRVRAEPGLKTSPSPSEQRQLIPRLRRRLEQVGAEFGVAFIQAQATASDGAALGEELSDGSAAAHAFAEAAGVEGSVAGLADQGEDALGAVGVVGGEPVLEELLDVQRQAQEDNCLLYTSPSPRD